jgi:hypothetical protein
MNLLREAEETLCPVNEPNMEVHIKYMEMPPPPGQIWGVHIVSFECNVMVLPLRGSELVSLRHKYIY